MDSSGPARPRVLVTRPQGQGGSLGVGLEALGFTVYQQPLLELQALPDLLPAQRQCLVDLDLYQHVIFISGNAVRYGMSWIEDYWPQLPVGLNWYAIGKATAGLLRDYGIEAIRDAGISEIGIVVGDTKHEIKMPWETVRVGTLK